MHIDHPYTNLTGGSWISGNLHSHTTASDGQRIAQDVIDDYAQRGHGYLMISDHDIYTGPDAYAPLRSSGMVLIPGNEISHRGPHMLHVNCDRKIEPYANRQQAITEAIEAGGFIVLNHPNWREQFDHFPIELMQSLTDYTGIEIFNGVIGRLNGNSYACDKWDMLLSAGKRVWGFANDDSHRSVGDSGLGWNVAYVREKTVEGIVSSLKDGRFYASTGVAISKIEVTDNLIRIVAPNADRIVAMKQFAARIKVVDGQEIELEVPSDAKYVRFECWGHGETFAWTQPFFVQAESK